MKHVTHSGPEVFVRLAVAMKFVDDDDDDDDDLVVSDYVLRAMTKKVVNFLGEKSAPQTKSWLRPWA